MRFESYVAFRYLRGKRKSRFVSLISLISVAGVSIGVIALLIPFLFDVLAPLYQATWRNYHASYVVFSALRFVLRRPPLR